MQLHPAIKTVARMVFELIAIAALVAGVIVLPWSVVLPKVHGLHDVPTATMLLVLILVPILAWRVTRWSQWQPLQLVKFRPKVSTRRTLFHSAVVVTVGLLLTALATVWVARDLQYEAVVRFDHLSEKATQEVTRRMQQYTYGLKGLRGLFIASKSVERSELRAYAESRNLQREFPGALGQGFIQRVPRAQLDQFLAETRADESPDFAVKTTGNAPDLFVIKFIEPLAANRAAWGYDVGSEAKRRAAAELAMRTGKPAVTKMIRLVQDDQNGHGLLCFAPVYRTATVPATIAERERTCIGWTYMPIVTELALANVADFSDHELDVEVFDNSDLSNANLIYDADNHLLGKSETEIEKSYDERTFKKEVLLPILGNNWLIRLSTNADFDRKTDTTTPGFIAAVGTMLTLLLWGMVWNLSTGRARAYQLADAMTHDLNIAKQQAEEASRCKSDFLANMSHEIRTPLTSILGFADLLDIHGNRDEAPRERLEYIDTIRRNGNHLLSVINDILDLSKIESGKMSVESIPTDIDLVMHDVLSLMSVKAAEKELSLKAVYATRIPRVILCDPVRLRQILMNLVGNAIKFTKHGRVNIIARYLPGPANQLQFAVVDTGIGLTPQQMERLFGTFVQADSSTTRKYGGSGLGLNISKRLAQMLGGDITVTSVPDSGSTFTVTIRATGVDQTTPMLEAGPAQVVSETPAKRRQVSGSACETQEPLAGVKILLAEDGPDNVRLLTFFLRKAGAQIKVVQNGAQAVQYLSLGGDLDAPLLEPPPVDLVLTDIQMPEMDGHTATRLLRAKGCKLPIIALTANAMSGDAEKCFAAGCDDYASKPIDRAKLISTIAQNLPAMSPALVEIT